MTVYFREIEDNEACKRWTSSWDKHEGYQLETVDMSGSSRVVIRTRSYESKEKLCAAMDRIAKRNRVTKDTTFTK